jgi:hypothetical protein
MSQIRFRQVARLEKRALPYIERKRRYEEENRIRSASNREDDFAKVAHLALLILYGEPKIGEPLTYAWRRCRESRVWKACRERHPDIDEESPFYEQGARVVAQYFREYILPDLPGADEIEKLNAVLAKAPPWLLWFTNAETSIFCLGLKLPDLSSVSRFARPEDLMDHLPDEAVELRPLPDGVADKFTAEFVKLLSKRSALEVNLTPRQRMRALRLKESDAMSGTADGSRDDPPDGDAVAACLRRMSQLSGSQELVEYLSREADQR